MAFAQLTCRESLRDIEACLIAVPDKLSHLGFRGMVSRGTLADDKEKRDWRIYGDLAASPQGEVRWDKASESVEGLLLRLRTLDEEVLPVRASPDPDVGGARLILRSRRLAHGED